MTNDAGGHEEDSVSASSAEEHPSDSRPAASASVRNSAGVFITRLVVLVVTVVSGLLTARYLGAHRRGVFAVFGLAGTLLLPLSQFGIGNAVVYYTSSRRYAVSAVFVTSLFLAVFHGVLAAAVLLILNGAGLLGDLTASMKVWHQVCILILLPIQAALLILTRLLMGDSQFGLSNRVNLGQSFVRAVLLLVLVAGLSFGLDGAVASVAVATAGTCFVLLADMWRRYRPDRTLDFGFARKAYSYGIRSWFGMLATRANLRLDEFLMAVFATQASLGQYSVVLRLSELLWVFPDSVAVVLFNRLSVAPESERSDLLCRVHRSVLFVTVAASAAAAAGAWLFLEPLLGADYAGSRVLVLLLLPGVICQAGFKVLNKFFGASGQPTINSVISTLTAAVGLLLYVSLIPLWDARGAAVACSLTYLLSLCLGVGFFRFRTGTPVSRLFRIRRADIQQVGENLRRVLSGVVRKPSRNSRRDVRSEGR